MLNPEKKYFLKKALMFSLVLTGIALLLFDTVLKAYYFKMFPFQLGLVAVVTVVSHLRLMRAIQMNIRRFNTTFLSIMSIKLFIYLIFILICLLIDRKDAINFVIAFLILYVFFTIFEVIEISNFLKKNTKSSN